MIKNIDFRDEIADYLVTRRGSSKLPTTYRYALTRNLNVINVPVYLVHKTVVRFRINIVTCSNRPIYKQITDEIRLAVSDGRLSPGEQLPSVRTLAEELLINPNTVARAFNDLVKEGVLESQHGKGAFVSRKRKPLAKAERLRRLEPTLELFLNEARVLEFTAEEIRSLLAKRLLRVPKGQNTTTR